MVTLSGDNIFFENYNYANPIIGFIANRLIQASTEELAVATAKRDILVHWNHSFNADRKLGMPSLHVENVSQFKGWLKPKTKHDYYWFADAETRQEQLAKFTQPSKKWFWNK